MLPGRHLIDAYPDMTNEEAVEQVVIFDEVYPEERASCRMSPLSKCRTRWRMRTGQLPRKRNAYRFRDTGVNFSEKYILPVRS